MTLQSLTEDITFTEIKKKKKKQVNKFKIFG